MAARETSRSFGSLLAIVFIVSAIYATIANNQRHDPSSSPSASVTKSNTQAAAPVSSPQPSVRECQPATISCVLERNEIIERNRYVMSGGEGQILPLSMIPIPPVEPLQALEVAKVPKAAFRASPRLHQERSPPATPMSPVQSFDLAETPKADYRTPSRPAQVTVRRPPAAVASTEPQTKPAPPTGDVQKRYRRNAIAPFTVLTEPGQNYLIKLVSVESAKDQIWIYLKGGESYSTKVPVGTYSFRAATGNEWYGREDLFGPNTGFFRLRPKKGAIADAPQTLQFRKERNRIVGMTISLKGVTNGNMEQESMTRSEFDAN